MSFTENLPAPLPLPARLLQSQYQPLSHKHIMSLFMEGPRRSMDDLEALLANGKITAQEGLILQYLYFIRWTKAATQSQYLRNIVDIHNYCQKNTWELSSRDVEKYISHLVETKLLKAGTVLTNMAGPRLYFDYLRNCGNTNANPTRLVRTPRVVESRISKVIERSLSFADFDKTLAALRKAVQSKAISLRDLCIFYIMSRTAPRASETCSLLWGSVIYVQGKWALRIYGKGDKERITVIPDEGVELLMELRKEEHGIEPGQGTPGWLASYPLFSHLRNRTKPMCRRNLQYITYKISQLAGIRSFSPHDLRHTCLTHMSSLGVNIKELKLTGGHAKIDTTMIYIDAGKILSSGTTIFNKKS